MKSICRACGEVFSTVNNFDRHRTGKYTQSGPDYGRRCLTTEEMAQDGMRLINGVWKGAEMPARVYT